tara:strand:- start:186 stop:599 length:414 start_codon:yes stop_codon:yes gene_type:complete
MISVYPRKQLDFSYSDIFKALLMSFNFKRIKENPIKKIEELWPKDNAIVGLSVRTILDTLLTLKNFTPGSEVLMSAINIPDMVDGSARPFIFSMDNSSTGSNAESEHLFARFAQNSLSMTQVANNIYNVKLKIEEEF